VTRSRTVSFWLLAVLLVFLLCGASAPSPLYAVYQELFAFPPVTLTVIYGVYALGGLGALLTTGRLSDYLGRRPVMLAALVGQIAGVFVFIAATDVVALLVGRLVLGLATGIALGAIGAWLIDLEPASSPGLGTLVNGVCTLLGLGLGAFGAGLLVQYAPDPLHLVFWLLAAMYSVAVVVVATMPDAVPRRPGWIASLRPTVSVPAVVLPLFAAAAPALVAAFALNGFYLSLGPSLATALLGSGNRVAGGLVILALIGTGAIAAVGRRFSEPGRELVRGPMIVVVGVALTLVGVAVEAPMVLYLGSAIAGVGLGPALSMFLRAVIPLTPAEQRGGLLSATYVVVFLSFSVPAVVGGAAVGIVGLRLSTLGYGLVVIALAVVSSIAVSRRLATLRMGA
jgi:MFS family permease